MIFANKELSYLTFMMCALLLISGCAKTSQSPSSTNAQPVPSPVQAPYVTSAIPGAPGSQTGVFNSSSYTTGATSPLSIVSSDEFNLFVASHPVVPENVLLNIDIKEVPTRGTYAGTVKIHYTSNGQDYEASLSSGTDSWNGSDYFMYNSFFNYQGKKVFTGFFEDTYGAIVLVFDTTIDLGDGAGPSQLGGSIWYKNFTKSFSSYDAGSGWSVVLPCWFRSIGPYNCQSSTVMNKSGLNPTADGYRKLGTFSNLSRMKALNLTK